MNYTDLTIEPIKIENDEFDEEALSLAETSLFESNFDVDHSGNTMTQEVDADKSTGGIHCDSVLTVGESYEEFPRENPVKVEVDTDGENDTIEVIIQDPQENTIITEDYVLAETEIPIPSTVDFEHSLTSHDSQDPLECLHSNDVFKRQSTRVRKLPKKLTEAEGHSNVIVKQRKIIDIKTDRSIKYFDDQSRVILSNNQTLQCTSCSAAFHSARTLLQHLKKCNSRHNVHPFDQFPKECPSSAGLKCHPKKHQIVKYNCHQCCLQFNTLNDLNLHLIEHLTCVKCALQFSSHADLELHLKKHVEVSAKSSNKSSKSDLSYACTECFRKFKSPLLLNHHLKVRHGEKLIDRINLVPNFSPSVLLHRVGSDQNPQCQERNNESSLHPKCPPGFQPLLNHCLENQQATKSAQSYSCLKCSRSFRRPGYLKLHLRGDCMKKATITSHSLKKVKLGSDSMLADTVSTPRGEKSTTPVRNMIHGSEHFDCEPVSSDLEAAHSVGETSAVTSATRRSNGLQRSSRQQPRRGQSSKLSSINSEKSSQPRKPLEKYACPKCPVKFRLKTRLISHLKLHSKKTKGSKKVKERKLTKHSIKFRSKTDLNSHSRSQRYSVNKRGSFPCCVCSAAFPTKIKLAGHYSNFHPNEKPYQCRECPGKFARERILHNHMYTVHGERKYECAECQAKFKSKVGIRVHLKHHELTRASLKPFMCSKCPSRFLTKGNLTRHMICVHDPEHVPPRKISAPLEKCFKCQYCPRWFLAQAPLTTHMSKKHSNEKPFSCSHCPLKFGDSKAFREHERNGCQSMIHLKCSHCPRTFNSLRNVKQHEISHTGKVPIECPECKNVYLSQQSFTTHIKKAHLDLKPYSCNECPLKFRSTIGLKNHLAVHTGKKYLCEICAFQFPLSSSLKAHMVTHKEERIYKCEHCSASFKRKNNLSLHIASHMPDRKTFACNVCSQKFKTPAHLRQHSVKHSGERPFACDFCPKTFGQLSTLKRHKMRHTGEKPFSCELCPAQFVQKGNLQTHMKIHLNEKPYKCTVCSVSFRQMSHLQVHERKHKEEKPFQCPLCDARFRQESNVETHLKKKHMRKLLKNTSESETEDPDSPPDPEAEEPETPLESEEEEPSSPPESLVAEPDTPLGRETPSESEAEESMPHPEPDAGEPETPPESEEEPESP